MRIIIVLAAAALIPAAFAKQLENNQIPADGSNCRSGETHSAQKESEISEFNEPTGLLTLELATAAVIENSPKLKIYDLDRRISEARELQAAASPNPEFEVEVDGFGGSGDFNGFNSAETAFLLSQTIELGGKLKKRKELASLDGRIAELDYQSAKLEALTSLASAYIDAAAAQAKTDMYAELVKLADDLHAGVSKQVEAGKSSSVDAAKAAMELSAAKMEHNQAIRLLEHAKKQLASHWDGRQALFDKIQADFTIGSLPDFEHLRGLMAGNPAILKLQDEISKSKAAAALEKANAKPDITISGGVKIMNDSDDTAFIVGLSIPLPISNTNYGQRLEAEYNLAKSYELRRQQTIEINNAFNEIQTAAVNAQYAAKELADNILPQAALILQAARNAYNQGKAGYIDVLDAQRMYLEKRNEYIEAASQYHKSMAIIKGMAAKAPGEGIN